MPNPYLTERENIILDLLAEGHNNKKVRKTLYLSEHTFIDNVSS
ncbi:LuxR C-terminal-related transcriptional regulator [Heyndrickxia sporothermodurans]